MSRGVPLLTWPDKRRARRFGGALPDRVPPPREIVLHRDVADVLRKLARPDWRWSHFPAGEHRDPRTGAKLKAMGLQAGWPDFQLIGPSGLFHGLELKRRGEDPTLEQGSFAEWCLLHGIPYRLVDTLDHALAVLTIWGSLREGVRL